LQIEASIERGVPQLGTGKSGSPDVSGGALTC
jgi:hypothetical protein